jgi:hypothetical protein
MNAAPVMSKVAKIWKRRWFHLSVLSIIVPIAYVQPYFALQAQLRSAENVNLRANSIVVGPWPMQLLENPDELPAWDPEEGYVKLFTAAPCKTCASEIRAIFINARKPGSTNAMGAEFEGSPYRPVAAMVISRATKAEDSIWLTVEGWDGSRHQAWISIADASPTTAQWLDANPHR